MLILFNVINLELLVTYENKNDCFKEASFSIRNQCSKLDQLDIEKIKCKVLYYICSYCK